MDIDSSLMCSGCVFLPLSCLLDLLLFKRVHVVFSLLIIYVLLDALSIMGIGRCALASCVFFFFSPLSPLSECWIFMSKKAFVSSCVNLMVPESSMVFICYVSCCVLPALAFFEVPIVSSKVCEKLYF